VSPVTHVLDICANSQIPAKTPGEIHPNEILPQAECCDGPEDEGLPYPNCQRQFRPIRWRAALLRTGEGERKSAQEKERGIKIRNSAQNAAKPPQRGRSRVGGGQNS
jgi:hypothetical protein